MGNDVLDVYDELDALFDIAHQADEVWPSFTNEKYPLDPDEMTGRPPRDLILRIIRGTLKDTFKASGKSEADWYRYCGLTDHKAVSRWLEHPEKMKAEHVDKTCELFGVSRDYLRGITAFIDSNADMWGARLVELVYCSLSDHHKKMVTDMLKELCLFERYEKAYRQEYNRIMARYRATTEHERLERKHSCD